MTGGKTSVLDETKKRLPDCVIVGDLAMQAAVAVGVVEFADYVEVTVASRLVFYVAGRRLQVSNLRYHFPVTLCTLAVDEKCTIMPDQIVRNYSVHKSAIRTNTHAIRILFRDSGYGNDVTLTFQPRSDMFSDDCWLVEQVPYEKLRILVDEWDTTMRPWVDEPTMHAQLCEQAAIIGQSIMTGIGGSR